MTTTSLLPDVGIELREGTADVGDVSLHYVEAGDSDGPLIVLLHGFPEFWYGWRLQIAPLAAAGFRVVSPGRRGYNLSSKPDGIAAYGADQLAADVRGLIQERGAKSLTAPGRPARPARRDRPRGVCSCGWRSALRASGATTPRRPAAR